LTPEWAGDFFETLLQHALRCEITIEQFWRMTPRETFMSIEAYFQREKRLRKQQISMAWLTAGLMRTKHMPALSRLLLDKRPQKTSEKELKKRRKEFAVIAQSIGLKLGKHNAK
jgi:hypothetical protein